VSRTEARREAPSGGEKAGGREAPTSRPLMTKLRARGFRMLFLVDAVVLYLAMVAIMVARFGFDWPTYRLSHYAIGFGIATAIHLTVGYFGGLYEHEQRLARRVWLPRVAWLTTIAALIGAGVALATQAVLTSPTGRPTRYLMPLGNLIVLAVVASLALTGTRWLSRRLVVRRAGLPRVLLVGSPDDVDLAAGHLAEDEIATVVDKVGSGEDLYDAVQRTQATDVLLLSPGVLSSIYPEPLTTLENHDIGVLRRVGARETLLGLREVREVAGMPVVPLRSHALPRSSAHFKRWFELVVVILLLPVLLVALAATATYVRLVAGRGILLRQERVGQGGRTFQMLKFRTMVPDAEEGLGPVLASRDDARIIPACRWLRQTRLDELPQVWNILKGEMSIVGPRPERPELTAEFERLIPGYVRRHEIPPGITGLAQVQGRYATDPEFKLGHDLQYLVNWSVVLDLQIMARTVWVVLTRRV
jgi:exopolysaccharide biosynthesis polyprenyl glycosylphosphotransferase